MEKKNMDDLEAVLIQGDLGRLSSEQKVMYHNKLCEVLGLNPLTKPFEYISFQGKTILYAGRNATEQLREKKSISINKIEHKTIDGMMIVTCYASNPAGRVDSSTAAVNVRGLTGEALANAIMKCETKAKRRVTLSICSLGMLDESEIESMKQVEREQAKLGFGKQKKALPEITVPTEPVSEPEQSAEPSDMPAMDPVEVITEGEVKSDKFDPTKLKFKYKIPYHVNGKDMEAVRAWLKGKNEFNKRRAYFNMADKMWYSNTEFEKLKEFIVSDKPSPVEVVNEQTGEVVETPIVTENDDLPEWMK